MKEYGSSAPAVTSYRALHSRGRLLSVDFSSVGGQNYTFYQCYDAEGLKALQAMVARPPIAQTTVAVTSVQGKPMLIASGGASPFAVLDALRGSGESLEQVVKHKSLDAWQLRSILGFTGQGLQLVSSFLRPTRQVDTSTFVFAASNLAANAINMVYDHGAELDDKHQLRYLKNRLNRELAPHLKAGEATFSIDEKRAKLHETSDPSAIDGAKGFLRRHSVEVGELGLRYLGAIGLAFPASGWKAAWQQKKIPKMDDSYLRRYTGLSSMFGKSVAFGAQIPDPYNPKPATLMDTVREKFAFAAGGVIEMTSFSALAYDCFFRSSGPKNDNWKRGLKINGKLHRDWLGGVGASLFVLAYLVRLFAPYGERKVDMKELYAHASDTLANTAPAQMPQLLANTAAGLTEHFEGSTNLQFSEIYTNLVNDLSRFHAYGQAPKVGNGTAAHKQQGRQRSADEPENSVEAASVELQNTLAAAPQMARAS